MTKKKLYRFDLILDCHLYQKLLSFQIFNFMVDIKKCSFLPTILLHQSNFVNKLWKMSSEIAKEELQTDSSHVQSYKLLNQQPSQQSTAMTIDQLLDLIAQSGSSQKSVEKVRKSPNEQIGCRKWSKQQSRIFFKLLETIGPDFICMARHIFFSEKRSKKELRNKYRKQSRKMSSELQKALQIYYSGQKDHQ